MQGTYWQKQGSKPLYPELEWNKPERRDQAGRLLIFGGSTHALAAPIKAYEIAKKQGVGDIRILLPDKTKSLFTDGKNSQAALRPLSNVVEFLPSTQSGEFSSDGKDQLMWHANWADTILLTGDIGRNSQTSMLLESFLRSHNGQVVLTKDAIESLAAAPDAVLKRPETTLIANFGQLQRFLKVSGASRPLQFTMDLVPLVYYLQNYTLEYPASIVTMHQGQLLAAKDGGVVSTKIEETIQKNWRIPFAATASCYLTWNPKKQLQSLAMSANLIS